MKAAVTNIDCFYGGIAKLAGSYLIKNAGRAAFIDNNTRFCVPRLLKELETQNMKPQDVDYVIITHVHLDHASGSAELMKACPNAKLLAHPRAARHAINPSRLVASATQVYGEEAMANLYGDIEGIPSERVVEVKDGETFSLGDSRPLKFLHTLGHAKHHMCVLDKMADTVFTGDSFGTCYQHLGIPNPFVMPTMSPTDFDFKEAVKTIDTLRDTGVSECRPTHFGAFPLNDDTCNQMKHRLTFANTIVQDAEKMEADCSFDELTDFCTKKWRSFITEELILAGAPETDKCLEFFKTDIDVNGQLGRWLDFFKSGIDVSGKGLAFAAHMICEKRRKAAA